MPRPRTRRPLPRRAFAMVQPRFNHGVQVKDFEIPKVREDWQADAYAYAQSVGEVNYALGLKANTLSECLLRPERRVPNTADEWDETDDARVVRVHKALKPPLGGQAELLRRASWHLDVAGEMLLYGAPPKKKELKGQPPSGLLWEFLSVLEVRPKKELSDGGTLVERHPWGNTSKGKEVFEQEAYLSRLHRPAADYSQRAQSPVLGVLPILKQIVLLTQVIDAIAESRLTANLLYVPWEISFGPTDEFANPGAPTEEALDEFEEELREHLLAPINDRSAHASLIPLLMRGPALVDGHPTKDLIGIIDLSRQLDDKFKALREEALHRLATGLDLPPELLKGKSTLSGLGGGAVAASVDEEFIEKHVVPPGVIIAEFLTVSYLRPMLQQFEGMTPEEAEWFRYTLDASPITATKDQSEAATKGHEMDILSDEAWLSANGFDMADTADEEQRYRRVLLKLCQTSPDTLAPVLLPVVFPEHPELVELLAKIPAPVQGSPFQPAAAVNGHRTSKDLLTSILGAGSG